jgi:predicted DNA-binding transcriptional regulator AlpA
MDHDEELLDVAQIADIVGVKPATIRQYAHRGDMPKPDRRFGRSPAWRRSTIARWLEDRPGQGAGGGRPRKIR